MSIDISGHVRTQVTWEILINSDLVIVMEEEHRKWIEERFDVKASLYNEIYKNEKTDVRINPPGSEGVMEEKLIGMVEYFEESMAGLIEAVEENYYR